MGEEFHMASLSMRWGGMEHSKHPFFPCPFRQPRKRRWRCDPKSRYISFLTTNRHLLWNFHFPLHCKMSHTGINHMGFNQNQIRWRSIKRHALTNTDSASIKAFCRWHKFQKGHRSAFMFTPFMCTNLEALQSGLNTTSWFVFKIWFLRAAVLLQKWLNRATRS